MMRTARAKFHLPFIMFIAGSISCQNQKASLPQQRYYYYPKTNIYYDAKSLEYIYSLDSGKSWVKMTVQNGNNAVPALGDQVSLKENDDNIWYENEIHRNMYGGTLYNVITNDTVFLAGKTKELKKPVVKQDTASSPKKKRNIFQKIFGKKKN